MFVNLKCISLTKNNKNYFFFLSLNEICEFFSRRQNKDLVMTSVDDCSQNKRITLVDEIPKTDDFVTFPCIMYVGVARF